MIAVGAAALAAARHGYERGFALGGVALVGSGAGRASSVGGGGARRYRGALAVAREEQRRERALGREESV